MSPKFYGSIWVLFALSAGIVWLLGAMSLLTLVVYGFITFGMVFMGMMCVLPGMVSHSREEEIEHAAKDIKSAKKRIERIPAQRLHFPAGLRTH